MNRSGKIHALLSTARVANIPSVVSNVWLGVAIGAACVSETPMIPWSASLRLVAAGIALYVAGNFLNDWADRKWDAERRPERALPRGLFSPRLYLGIAMALGMSGVSLAATVDAHAAWVAVGIAASVCLYTYSHKRTPWAVVPMGLCRALLPVMGALGVYGICANPEDAFSDRNPMWVIAGSAAGGLFCYIMGLSLSARYESMKEPPRGSILMSKGLLVLAALVMCCPIYWIPEIDSIIGRFLPYCMWLLLCMTLHRKPIPVYVSGLLAGIPLLDWILMLPLLIAMRVMDDGWSPSSIACFAIPPLAFLSALLLQRLAPAT